MYRWPLAEVVGSGSNLVTAQPTVSEHAQVASIAQCQHAEVYMGIHGIRTFPENVMAAGEGFHSPVTPSPLHGGEGPWQSPIWVDNCGIVMTWTEVPI
jgi:hypothetical protein